MITVNLLPHELRPVKRTPLPYILSAAGALLILLLVASMYLTNRRGIAKANELLAGHQRELEELKPIVDEYNSLSEQKIGLSKQVETIDGIVNDRIIWSRQLYNLTRLAPENLWYEEIKIIPKTFPETEEFYNKQTKQTEQRTIRITKQVLAVSGYVAPGADGKMNISTFTIATESDPEFSSLFQLDQSTFKDTKFEDENVREFSLEYILTPERAKEAEKASAAGGGETDDAADGDAPDADTEPDGDEGVPAND